MGSRNMLYGNCSFRVRGCLCISKFVLSMAGINCERRWELIRFTCEELFSYISYTIDQIKTWRAQNYIDSSLDSDLARKRLKKISAAVSVLLTAFSDITRITVTRCLYKSLVLLTDGILIFFSEFH